MDPCRLFGYEYFDWSPFLDLEEHPYEPLVPGVDDACRFCSERASEHPEWADLLKETILGLRRIRSDTAR